MIKHFYYRSKKEKEITPHNNNFQKNLYANESNLEVHRMDKNIYIFKNTIISVFTYKTFQLL